MSRLLLCWQGAGIDRELFIVVLHLLVWWRDDTFILQLPAAALWYIAAPDLIKLLAVFYEECRSQQLVHLLVWCYEESEESSSLLAALVGIQAQAMCGTHAWKKDNHATMGCPGQLVESCMHAERAHGWWLHRTAKCPAAHTRGALTQGAPHP